MDCDSLGLLDKSKIPGNCRFPPANQQFDQSIDFVPDENIGKYSEGMYIGRSNLKLKYYQKNRSDLI